MDAIEFMKESNRMCKAFNENCKSKDGNNFYCGLRHEADKNGELCDAYIRNHPDKAVAIVEKWAKDHPRKTRQSEFLKMFPRAGRGEDGLIVFCPEDFDSKFECPLKRGSGHDLCGECRKNYWLEEVDDDVD